MEGITISYLRRVPELNHLASRIVASAYKARYKEQRKLARSSMQSCRKSFGKATSTNESLQRLPRQIDPLELRRKVKTLFIRTVQELHRDGSIVLSSGVRRALPQTESGFVLETRQIWKVGHRDSLPSTLSDQDTQQTEYENRDFSEPEDGEDAYLPLTQDLLCMKVADALVAMHRSSVQMRVRYSVPGDSPLFDGKIRPPSPGEISIWLSREEEWRQVGELLVIDALRHLCDLNVVYKVPHGRWQIQAEHLRKALSK